MTTLLEPNDYGIYTLLIAFQGMCGLIFINPVGQHINRHTHGWWDDGTLLRRLARYNKYIASVSAGIAIVVIFWWSFYTGTDQDVVEALLSALAVSATVYFGTWNGTIVYILNMLGVRGSSVRWMLSTSIVGLAFSTLLAWKYHTGNSWLMGQAVGMAVGALGAGLVLKKYHSKRKLANPILTGITSLVDKQTIVNYCIPLAMATGLMWIQNTGYRFVVGGYFGITDLGYLAVGLSISTQIWAIIESLSMQLLTPYFFRHISSDHSQSEKSAILSDLVNIMWPIYAVLAAFNLIFAAPLLNVLTNERYHSAVTFICLSVLIEFARCTSNLWSYAAQIEKRTKKYIAPNIFSTLIIIVGFLVIFNYHGTIVWMAAILLLSSLVSCLSMIYVMQKMTAVKMDAIRWSASLLILIFSGFVVIVSPLKADNFIWNLEVIACGLMVTGGIMLAFIYKNPALLRLLSVKLRN